MIDYFCKYVELKPPNSITDQAAITETRSICGTHGMPEELIRDGKPTFNSDLML